MNPRDIPAGRYALYNSHDRKIHFFQVDQPDEGRWAGYTFLNKLSGPNRIAVKDRQQRLWILNAIGRNPLDAMARYGRETNECGKCHTELTDETSRDLGIGPVCIKKYFGITQAQALMDRDEHEMNAAVQQREREEDERVAAYKAARDGF